MQPFPSLAIISFVCGARVYKNCSKRERRKIRTMKIANSLNHFSTHTDTHAHEANVNEWTKSTNMDKQKSVAESKWNEHDAFFPWLFQFSNCILMEIAHTNQPPASQLASQIRIICRIRLCMNRITRSTARPQNRKRNKNSVHKLLTIAAIEHVYTLKHTVSVSCSLAHSFNY